MPARHRLQVFTDGTYVPIIDERTAGLEYMPSGPHEPAQRLASLADFIGAFMDVAKLALSGASIPLRLNFLQAVDSSERLRG